MIRFLRGLTTAIAVILAVIATLGLSYEPNTVIPVGLAGKHVTVKGIPVRVVERGSGRNVLLIHGSPGSIEDWAPVMEALGGSMHVTAFDRPGSGYSGDTGAYSPQDNADLALSFIDALSLEHVIVVGHSYGGATALAMAVRPSTKVDAFVIIDSAAYEPTRKPDPVLRLLELPFVGMGFAVLMGPSLAPSKIRTGLLKQFVGGPPGKDFIDLRTRIWSTPKVTHSIAAETLGYAKNLKALSPSYPAIRRPVFILAEADEPARRSTAEHLHSDIPGSSLDLLSKTGHYIQFDKTREVVETIRRADERTR